MIKIINLFTLCFFALLLNAQNGNDLGLGEVTHPNSPFNIINSVQLTKMMNSTNLNYEKSLELYEDFNGSPFLFENFQSGYVVFNDGEQIENIDLNFDIYSNNILTYDKKGNMIALDERFFMEIGFYGDKDSSAKIFRKVDVLENDDFYEILYSDDKTAFLKKYNASIREAQQKGVAVIPGRIIITDEHFLQKDNGYPDKLKLKSKSFLEQFDAEQRSELEILIKRHKLKMKEEQDYITALKEIANNQVN